MEKIASENPATGEQNLVMSKLLLLKYNILHEFHVKQLELYIIACCNISIDGVVRISRADHVISYEIKTMKFFKKEGSKTVKRPLYSLLPFYTKKKYNEELKMAKNNLVNWTKELMWGDDTFVKVVIDGKEID